MLLLAAGLALPAFATDASMTPDEVIAAIEAEMLSGVSTMRGIVIEFAEDVESADSQSEANEERWEAIDDVTAEWKNSKTKIIQITFGHHSHPEVQEAFENALNTLEEVEEASIDAINELYQAAYPPATTTTSPSTTAPGGATTTSTSTTGTSPPVTPPPPVTTTTTLPATALPSDFPDKPESDLMAAAPEAAEVSAESATEMGDETGVVGLITRVVDSQLPDGVSAVATGPLVVLGLVLDAIRAAGVFMIIPWILLLGYMAVLLAANRWKPAIAVPGSASS